MCPRILFFALLIASLASPALTVTLGPEVEVADRVTDAGDGSSSHRAVAAWGGNYYVVWAAPRALMLGVFDAEGNRLDERALVSGVSPSEALIVDTGSRMVVIWSDTSEIRISELSEDGELVTPGGVGLGTLGTGLDIATSSSGLLVIWRNGPTLRGVILDHDFQALAAISGTNVSANSIRTASDGDRFLLVWTGTSQSPGLFTCPVASDGTLGTPVLVDAEPQESAPAIVWNGSHHLISSAVQGGLRMSLVDSEGTPSGTPVLTWAQSHVTRSTLRPQRFGFLVVAEHWIPVSGTPETPQPTRLYSFIVSRTGDPLSDPTEVATVGAVNTIPALASNGDGYFATWNYSPTGLDLAVRGTVIRANGQVLFTDGPIPGLTVSRGVRNQSVPIVAAGSQLFLSVWVDFVRERNEYSLRLARLDPSGRSLDGTGIELFRSDFNPRPSFACGVDRCLATYQIPADEPETHSLIGRWISVDGRFVTEPFTIAPRYLFDYSESLSTDGERFATVAQSVLHVIGPFGNVITTPVPGVADTSFRRYLVASNGDGFAVFWSEGDVKCVRFDRDGIVTAETTVLTGSQELSAVAGGGNEYLLTTDRLSGLRISNGGVAIGGLFSIATNRGRDPAVAWNGSNWFVCWTQYDTFGRPTGMYVTSVSPGGIAGTPIQISASGEQASIAGDDSGASMVVFPVSLDTEVFGTVTRLYARSLDADSARKPRRRGVRRP